MCRSAAASDQSLGLSQESAEHLLRRHEAALRHRAGAARQAPPHHCRRAHCRPRPGRAQPLSQSALFDRPRRHGILSTHIVEDVRELCPRMAIIAAGKLLLEGSPGRSAWSSRRAKSGRRSSLTRRRTSRAGSAASRHFQPSVSPVSTKFVSMPTARPATASARSTPASRMSTSSTSRNQPFRSRFAKRRRSAMALFWEFFSFELKFRLKSLSTYVYFAFGSFSASFPSPLRTSSPRATASNCSTGHSPPAFSMPSSCSSGPSSSRRSSAPPCCATSSGTPFQLIFTKPITKFAYLGGRWAGSFVTCVFAFSGIVFGEACGDIGTVGRSHTHCQRPPLVVLAAFPFHRRYPDLLPRLVLLCGRRAVAQDFRRVPTRRGRLHDVSRCQRDLLRNPFARHFWSAIFDPSQHAVTRRTVAVIGPLPRRTRCSSPGRPM